jgi:long-subunit fatty acid transport protein
MINKIIVSLCLFLSLVSFAQEGTSSPYSFYGLGDVRFRGTVENRSMGGLSVLSDSIHINLQNPAQLASLKLTSFAVAGTFTPTKMKTSTQEEKSQRTTFDYLAVGLPSKKFGFGFGLIPFSSVGYKILNLATETDPTTRKYSGTGGINKAFAGVGYQINKKLSIGADFQYNFGTIETKSINFIDGVQFGSREINRSEVSGVNFNLGLAFQSKISKKLTLFSGLTYTPQANLNLSNERKIATIQFLTTGGESVVDEENIDVDDSKLKMPSKLTFGTAIGQVRKWMIGGEITFQGTSNLGNRFNDINNATYENSIRYSLGGYYIPKYSSYTSYLSKVTYRGGFRYENTGLLVFGEQINDYAMTLGLGLPLGGTFSNINIGAEFGKRGTTNAGLIEENYTNISLGFTFNDEWFKRRKIN